MKYNLNTNRIIFSPRLVLAKMRPHFHYKKRTAKILDRITHSPEKHKHKYVEKLRRKLATRVDPDEKTIPTSPTSIKFGSININGLDLEASWAVDQLLTTRGFDVGLI